MLGLVNDCVRMGMVHVSVVREISFRDLGGW